MRRETRWLVISIHDVAPQYHLEVARWRETLLLRQAGPVSLLVVPRHHGQPHREGPRVQWLRRLAHAGDEIALHGYAHVGVADGEAEMKGRSPHEIHNRVTEGLAELRALGLDPSGFVAPCYAHPPACDAACRAGSRRVALASTLLCLQLVGPRRVPRIERHDVLRRRPLLRPVRRRGTGRAE